MKTLARTAMAILCLLQGLNLGCKPSSKEANTAVAKSPTLAISPTAQPEQLQAAKFPPRRTFNHKFKIVSDYDKFKDVTSIWLKDLGLGSGLRLSAFVPYTGQKLTYTAPMVMVLLTSESQDWRFDKFRETTVLADNERINLGEFFRSSHDRYRDDVMEILAMPVKVENFLKIVNAHNVEFQVGVIEFKLEDKHLEALRDLASRMTPSNEQ